MTWDLGVPRQKPCDVLGRARNNRRALEERITAVAPVGGGKIKAVFPKWFAPSRISSRLGSLQFLELWAPNAIICQRQSSRTADRYLAFSIV
jgi:hypothetical protein